MKDISSKNQLRLKTLDKRERISMSDRETYSSSIFSALYKIEEYKNADTVLFYVNYRSEVITKPYIEKALSDGKRVYCPRVEGLDISFFRIDKIQGGSPGEEGHRL